MTNRSKAKGCIILFCVLLITIFIISNSVVNYEKSHSYSGYIVDNIVTNENFDRETVDLLVRKTAHVMEFALLGTSVIGLTFHIRRYYQKSMYGAALFYVLAVAVLDEHIQSFSDRTSSTGDILLDFLGALVGFGIVFIIRFIIKKLKERNSRA